MKTLGRYRKNVAAAASLALVLLSCATVARSQPGRAPEKKKVFTEEDERVEQIPGKWRLASSVDLNQAYNYSIPVIVREITTSYGQGKYAGRIKMTEAKLENRVQKLISSVQLRWSILKHEEPETVLLEGLVPFFDVHIEANREPLVVDIPHIYFNKIVKPLLKDGELNGHLRLVVGVHEVRFADGSTWQRLQQSAFM